MSKSELGNVTVNYITYVTIGASILIATLLFQDQLGWKPIMIVPGAALACMVPLLLIRSHKLIVQNRLMLEELQHKNLDLENKNELLKDFTIKVTRQSERIQEVDKMKDEFVSMITHELKTPLVPVQGYCELLLKGTYGTITEKQKAKIRIIYDNSTRLLELIQDLLDINKLELGKMKLDMIDTSAGVLVEECIKALMPAAKEKSVMLVNIAGQGDGLRLRCDPNRVLEVLDNIVSNAIKFVPENKGLIEIGARRDNGSVLFSVRDNGIGIPREKQQNLFKKFYQIDTSLRRPTGGSGLGLAISKGIVEAHGGKIWLESEEGRGATFYFELPAGGLN